jgi:hypothetical protein
MVVKVSKVNQRSRGSAEAKADRAEVKARIKVMMKG